jgi:inner membrane protease ATP23
MAPTPPQPSSPPTQPSTSSNTSSEKQQQSQPQTQSSKDKPPLRFLENDPARTGYDPSLKWWVNYFKILTGQITPEGIEHYREDRYKVHEARDCARCERDRDYLFKYSPVIRFLREKVAALNGDLNETNVVCRRCPARVREDGSVMRQGGGFSPEHGILICANEMRDRSHLEDTLAHEMVHAWDHLRFKVDWSGSGNLRHAACTEVCVLPPIIPRHGRNVEDMLILMC